jgi:hypothetical protein
MTSNGMSSGKNVVFRASYDNLYTHTHTDMLLDKVVFREDGHESILFGVEDSVLREEDSLDSIAAATTPSSHQWIDEETLRRMHASTPIRKVPIEKKENTPPNLKSENRKLRERVAYLSRLGKRNTKRLSSQARVGAEMKSLRVETQRLKETLENRDAEVVELRRQIQVLEVRDNSLEASKEEYDNLLLEHTRLKTESSGRKKTHDILKAQLETERAQSAENEERVIELEQVLFERDREISKIQAEVDMLQAKLNASEETCANLERRSNEMTKRAEESEKWIESHEEMGREMEIVREKLETSETRNMSLKSELKISRKTISDLESKIRNLESESAKSLEHITTTSESSKSRLNAMILKLNEDFKAERARSKNLMEKLEESQQVNSRIAIQRLDRVVTSKRRSDCRYALNFWKKKTQGLILRLRVFRRVVLNSIEKQKRDMFRRGFHGLIRGVEIMKAQEFVNDLNSKHVEEKICLTKSHEKDLSTMRNTHVIALEKARRDALSARSRALKETSREEFREALRLNRHELDMTTTKTTSEQIEKRNCTNEKISTLREMIVKEKSSSMISKRKRLMLRRRNRRIAEKQKKRIIKTVRPEETMLGLSSSSSTLLYAQSLAAQERTTGEKKKKSWKTKLSEYAVSSSSPHVANHVQLRILSVERLMVKVRNQGISNGISSDDVSQVLCSTNVLLNRAKTWMEEGDVKSAMSAIKEASARANAAREAIFVISAKGYLKSIETSLDMMCGGSSSSSSKAATMEELRKLVNETRIRIRDMSVEKIQGQLGLISEIHKKLLLL